MAVGTQFGSNHRLELGWAEAVMRLVPSVERVRFTSSGTEATLMALRLARDFTGKPRILRFRTHFHGWHDHMTHGVRSEEHTSELQSLMRISYAVFCLKKKTHNTHDKTQRISTTTRPHKRRE